MESDDSLYKQFSLLDNLSKEVSQHQSQVFSLPDAKIVMYSSFFGEDESNRIFADLCETIQWKQEDTFLYGKTVALPRLTAWYGDQGKTYTYSKIRMTPDSWIPILEHIRFQVEEVCGEKFNSVLKCLNGG